MGAPKRSLRMMPPTALVPVSSRPRLPPMVRRASTACIHRGSSIVFSSEVDIRPAADASGLSPAILARPAIPPSRARMFCACDKSTARRFAMSSMTLCSSAGTPPPPWAGSNIRVAARASCSTG